MSESPADAPAVRDLQPLSGLARWAVRIQHLSWALALGALAGLALRGMAEESPSTAAGDGMEAILVLLELLRLAAHVAALTVFFFWLHRAVARARCRTEEMEYTPGMAILWWFIPIFNFYKPYLVMDELWRASRAPRNWQETSSHLYLLLWWILWWTSQFGWRIVDRVARAVDVPGVSGSALPRILQLASIIAAALLSIRVVKDITSAQEERFHAKR